MNLHQIVSGAISTVNPPVAVDIRASSGSTTAADGTRTPAFDPAVRVVAQVQPLTGGDLRQIEGLNLQGVMKAIYINGDVSAIVRVNLKGGDLVDLPDGSTWLVAQILEGFNLTAGWTKAVIVLQNGA